MVYANTIFVSLFLIYIRLYLSYVISFQFITMGNHCWGQKKKKKRSAFFIWNFSLKISLKLVTVSFVLGPGLNPLLKFLREIDGSKNCNTFHFPFRGTFGNLEGGKILSFSWSCSDLCQLNPCHRPILLYSNIFK